MEETTAAPAAEPPVIRNDTLLRPLTGLPLASTICAWRISAVVPSGGEGEISTMRAVAGLVTSGVVATKVAVAGLLFVMASPSAVAVKVTVPALVFFIVIV